jgi:hypothetical protein
VYVCGCVCGLSVCGWKEGVFMLRVCVWAVSVWLERGCAYVVCVCVGCQFVVGKRVTKLVVNEDVGME